MIVVYILLYFGPMNPVPPMADMASCERVRAAVPRPEQGKCIQVVVPATSRDAYQQMPNRIGKP